MAAREAGGRRAGALLAAAFWIGVAACAPRPEPRPMPPQTVTRATPEPPPPSEPPVAAPVPVKNEPVVIESGDTTSGPTTSEALVEAARRERERRRLAPQPAIVLDNKSLSKYAGGQLTVAAPAARSPEAAALDQEAERESYWRERALSSRRRWREALDAIGVHEKEAAELRNRFYSTDDPYVRDGQVKPAWDRALDLLAQAKRDAAAAQAAVDETMEQGRRAGALPGWLREGLELEPEPAPSAPAPRPADPAEPRILEQPPRNPGDPP